MKHYNVTAKLWIKIDAQTGDEAETRAKNIVDEALYEYIAGNQRVPDVKVGVSKAKITWVKEDDKKENVEK